MSNGSAGAIRALFGFTQVRVSAAAPVLFLNECTRLGIPFWGAQQEDECTLRLQLRWSDTRRAEAAARRCGCDFAVLSRRGGPAALRRLRRQLYLCVGVVAVMTLLFVSSLYIWDIRVVENPTDVPDREILAVLDEIGVGIGSRWTALSSDMVRAEALLRLPELSYLTVNVHGSRAEVLVRGKVPVPEMRDEKTPTEVRAEKGGVITEMRVLEGESLAAVGDTVMPGDTLVSAERGVRRVHARAEITARTWYEKTACAPLTTDAVEAEGVKHRRWGLILGKRRVNFSFNSGIHEETCDRITNIYPLALGGVFTLPVALFSETTRELTTHSAERDVQEVEAELCALLREGLMRELGDEGEIVTERFSISQGEGLLYVTMRAECLERIDMEAPVEP